MEKLYEIAPKKHEHKFINYCDGFLKVTFTFNRECTKDEFVAYLKNLGQKYPIKPKTYWWEKYTEISGSGNTWVWKEIDPYTD